MNYLKEEVYELVKSDYGIFDFIQEAFDGLWCWDIDNPENEWVSPRFWLTLGYDPDEMSRRASARQQVIHPHDLKSATESFSQNCQNSSHPYEQEVRYIRKDGSTTWMRCRALA